MGMWGKKILQWKEPKLPKSIFKIVMWVSSVAYESTEFILWQEERVECLWRYKTKFQNKETTALGVWDGRKLLIQAHSVEAGLSVF